MKRMLWMLAICAGTIGLQAQVSDAKLTYIGHDTVAKGGVLLTAKNLIVQVNTRTEGGQSELHDKETDTFYVLDGEATFLTGGEMIESKPLSPGQYRGTGLKGGQTHHLTKGDVIVIPAGMPHWFKDVQKPFVYYIVKVVAP